MDYSQNPYVTQEELEHQADSAFSSSYEDEPLDLLQSSDLLTTNENWQRAIDLPDSAEKWTTLARIGLNFVQMAKTYSKVIISELNLPRKTIPPCSIGLYLLFFVH